MYLYLYKCFFQNLILDGDVTLSDPPFTLQVHIQEGGLNFSAPVGT